MTLGNPNTFWAESLLDEFFRAGVRHVCVAPGSRSTSLVLAAASHEGFRLHSILDERSAGFFALGIGKATGTPAVVITTSGTAAANLYPAVVEASQGEVPLLVLTADRPHHLRDSDENQAMDQARLFGNFARAFFDVSGPRGEPRPLRHLRGLAARAFASAQDRPMGPVHLNLPFEKPFEPSGSLERTAGSPTEGSHGREEREPLVRVSAGIVEVSSGRFARLRERLDGVSRGIIVAGPVPDSKSVGAGVLALGAATGFPVLADPLSGARFAPHGGALVPAGYDLFLQSPRAVECLAPQLILRVGASPTSASLLGFLEAHAKVRQIVVDDGHRWKDHLASAWEYLRVPASPLLHRLAAGVSRSPDPTWTQLWSQAEACYFRVLNAQGFRCPGGPGPDTRAELLEGEILAAVAAAVPEDANLLVASSMPIRDLDGFARPGPKRINVFGNRGVSGIDGLISTAAGIATGAESRRPTVAVLGDLAFLHDLNGLLSLIRGDAPLVLVVINNDGGGIFHTLPVRAYEPAFTRFFATPHGLTFGKAAEMYGLPYGAYSELRAFEEGLQNALASERSALLEVRTRREESHVRRAQVVRAVIEEVGAVICEGF